MADIRTVVSGFGLVHPAGNAEALICGSAPADFDGMECAEAVASLSDYFPKPSLRRLPSYVRVGLLAAVRALENAGQWPCPGNMPIVIGSAYCCQKTSFDFMDSILDFGPKLASPLSFSHAVNNMAAGLFSLMLKSTGSCMTINNSQLSFAGALQTAVTMLDSGKADKILVGAVDEFDTRFGGLFPHKKLIPSAAFFCLSKGTEGFSIELDWEDTDTSCAVLEIDGRAVSLCSRGEEDSLFQPLACAAFCSGGAMSARIVQTASEYGTAALIHLKRV
ncbi:MAG: beta-ketoacyl synthase chain length factor [Mailhella sp.]|nr:beta-ketoacyl synthase chain length factor [Mailhella sp.]